VSSSTGWVSLIVTTLAGGVVGSLVTTYATQSRARLDARNALREEVRKTEALKPRTPGMGNAGHAALRAQLAVVERAAQMAGVPRSFAELYREALLFGWVLNTTRDPQAPPEDDAPRVVYGRVGHSAAGLLLSCAWHPWRARLWGWYQVRRFGFVLRGVRPDYAPLEFEAKQRVKGQMKRFAKDGKASVRAARRRGL
jgi:hypothetical protein